MSFSSEFRNVTAPNVPSPESIEIPPPPGIGASDFKLRDALDAMGRPLWISGAPSADFLERARTNTLALQAIVSWMSTSRPPIPGAGIVYFPPGRYYLGRSGLALPTTEAETDIVIPPNISLRFALGATVVLFDYSALATAAQGPFRRSLQARPNDSLKVSMEIQGSIDAGPWPIFDSVLEDLSTSAGWNAAPSALHTSGPVFLTRNTVPEVCPEWFGASIPPTFTAPEPTPALVRRMTLGLQEAIEVAHTRRHIPKLVAVPPIFPPPPPEARGIAGVLRRQRVLPDEIVEVAEPGWVLFEGTMFRAGRMEIPRWNPSTLTGVGFKADYDSHPPIPIVLSGEYIIDRELQVGFSLDDAEHYSNRAGDERPGPLRQPNIAPFVLQGRPGSTSTGAPLATIRAHAGFQGYARDPSIVTSAAASLLGVRGPTGAWIENVTFAAAFAAPRCLTFDTVTRAQMHNTGVTGCAFFHAREELLHIGGEASPARGVPPRKPFMNTFGILHFSHSQDLLGMRVSRCLFDTGPVDVVRSLALFTGTVPTGVLYRAGQAMAAVFEHCSFTGAAAPMFHAVTLRMSIVGCFFDTRAVGPGDLDGADLWIDTPAFEGPMPGGALPSDPTSLTIKDIVSRSPRFITSFRTPVTNVANHTAIYLIGVDHRPTLRDDEPLPPAILWAGPARSGGRLMLQGCRFDRLSRPLLPDDVLQPVAIDLASGTADDTVLGQIVGGINESARSDGHVIDLGTVVLRPNMTLEIATFDLRGLRSASTLGSVVGARIFEKYVRM